MDPVSRSRMERLGKLNIHRDISKSHRQDMPVRAHADTIQARPSTYARRRQKMGGEIEKNKNVLESCSDSVKLRKENADSQRWTIGQQIDVRTISGSNIQWRNATILNMTNSTVLVGFRIYHENGPFTESRDPRTTAGREARLLALISEKNSGEKIPTQYYGSPGEHWTTCADIAKLGSKTTDLLDKMGEYGHDVMHSLSRRMLRRSRQLSNDRLGAAAMDKAMAAYQASQGPLYYYSSPNGKSKKFDAWRSLLSAVPHSKEKPVLLQSRENPALKCDLSERRFVPSLMYNGDHPGYRYELKDQGLGYYSKDPDPETLETNERRDLQIRDRRRELETCVHLIQDMESDLGEKLNPEDENEKQTTLKVMKEREIDIRVQLAMLLRLEVEAMWKQEKEDRPPLEDEHQCGPSGGSAIAMIREALDILRGALLRDPQNASARLNSVELTGMLPVMVRSEMFGASFTFDNVYAANPNVFPEFVQKRVPRTKFYDENYRLLRSFGGGDLPSSAWLNSAVRKPGERKDALRARVNDVVICIQRCYLRRHRIRCQAATIIQRAYRSAVVRVAVERKVLREMRACTRIFAVWRGFLWRRELWWMNVAATKITSLARGKHGRWMAWLRRMVAASPEAPYLVVRVQALVRGVQSRWHQREAKRRLKSIRFLCRLGVWMLRYKKLRDRIVLSQSIARRFLTYRFRLPHQRLLFASWKAKLIQRVWRGMRGRKQASSWFKGILRLQGLFRSAKGRRLAGIDLASRLANAALRDSDERKFVAMKVREAVNKVDIVLSKAPHGSDMLRRCAKRLRRSSRQYWMKRVALRARLVGTPHQALVMRRARLAATFAKFDWHRNGRLGLRALKALIVDELCVPLSPEDFVRLSALLDDRVVGCVKGSGSTDAFLQSLAQGEEDGPRGLYVTFGTFYRWWMSRNGLPIYDSQTFNQTVDSADDDTTIVARNNVETSTKLKEDVKDQNSEQKSSSLNAGAVSTNVNGKQYRSLSTTRTTAAASGARIAVVGGKGNQTRRHLHAMYALRTKRAVRKLCSIVGCSPEIANLGGDPKYFAWHIGGVRGEARETILANVIDRVFKDATVQYRMAHPPVAECEHCLRPFATVTDYLIHRDGSILAGVRKTYGRSRGNLRKRRSRNRAVSFMIANKVDETRALKSCKARILLDSDYMVESHTLSRD